MAAEKELDIPLKCAVRLNVRLPTKFIAPYYPL